MRAVKGNKEYTIEESQQKNYQDVGFDILDTDGNVIAYGRGKTVPYEEYMETVREIEHLQKLCADLKEENVRLEKDQESTKSEKKPAVKRAGE